MYVECFPIPFGSITATEEHIIYTNNSLFNTKHSITYFDENSEWL